jgi:anti-sigma factor RsiW
MTSLTCREVSEFLMEYVGDSLPEDIHSHFESHVDACDNCRTFLLQYRETIAAGRLACCDDAAPVDCPEDLVRAVMAALRSTDTESKA